MTEDTIFYLKVGSTDPDNYELIAAERVSADNYLLIETPIQSCGLNYGTTVLATLNAENELEIVRIVAPSVYKTRQFIRTSSLTSRELSEKIGNKVIAAGGHWEIASAGLAFAHIPKESSFDLDELFEQNNYYPLEITIAGKLMYQQISASI